jgi:hypothetical protein
MGKRILNIVYAAAILMTATATVSAAPPMQQSSAASAKALGTIKSISGTVITLTTDSGDSLTIQVLDTTRLLRVAPGQDLKEAAPITLQEIQAGDRILVRGKPSNSDQSLTATTIVTMKKGDIAQKQQKDLQDWQRHGIGGLVKATDPSANTVTVSTVAAAGAKSVTVKLTPKTIVRRYSPDSIKFDDAKPGTLADIKPGDQLRARGNKNDDGTEFAADEVVSGTFRNLAGLITGVDTAKNTITVNDLSSKKPVTIRITGDSQMHKLSPQIAQRIAMRLKGVTPPDGAPGGAAQSAGQPTQHPQDLAHPAKAHPAQVVETLPRC